MAADRQFVDSPSYETRYERVDGGAIVTIHVHGDLDLAEAPHFAEALHQALGRSRRLVAADLSGVSFMDSSGLQQLVLAQRMVNGRHADFVLVAPSSAVVRILDLCHLADHFDIRDRASAGRLAQDA